MVVVVDPVDRALSGPPLTAPELVCVGVGVDRGVRREEVGLERGVRLSGVGVERGIADFLVDVFGLVVVDEVVGVDNGISTSTSKAVFPLVVELESGSTESALLPARRDEVGAFLLDEAADEGKGDPTGVTLELLNDLLMGVNISPELAPACGVG